MSDEAKFLSAEELLATTTEEAPTETIPGPNSKGMVKLVGIIQHSKLMNIFETVDRRRKLFLPGKQLPDTTVESLAWIEACMVEPKLTYDQLIALSERAGWWITTASNTCRKLCGITPETVEGLVEGLKESPFEEPTIQPVLKDSKGTPKSLDTSVSKTS